MTRNTVWLLDANVLIAMTQSAHIHHVDAHNWFGGRSRRRWATCALTQLAFVRLTSNPKIIGSEISPAQAIDALATMTAQATHEYWPESPDPLQLSALQSPALVGHRQVTDAYLLGLAVHKGQRLATLDRGLFTFAAAAGVSQHIELVGVPATMVQEPTAKYGAKRSKR